MKNILNVLLIEDSSDYAELVQQWLSAGGDQATFVLSWTDSLASGLSRLAQGGIDVILLDLGLPDSEGANTYSSIHSYAPQTPVIILSAADSESLALRMIQAGAEDYLVKSACTADHLMRAVRYAQVRHRFQKPKSNGPGVESKILGFLGAQGGVGTTTVACHVAAELRRQTNQAVLLMDLDLRGGLIPFLTAIEPKYSILDALNNLDRLDRSCWEAIATRTRNDLDAITGPNGPNRNEAVNPESLQRLLEFLQTLYPWIVVDLGRLGDAASGMLEKVHELFVVTTPSIPALYQAKRTMDAVGALGFEKDRVRLVMNRANQSESLSGKDLTMTFGTPVYATLPNDDPRMHQACLNKQLVERQTELGSQFSRLVRRITGLQEEPAHGLFSFISRWSAKSGEARLREVDNRHG